MQGRDITPQDLAKFIQKLKATNGNVSKACQAVKLSRKAVYEHKKNNPDFAQEWEDALEKVYDSMEEEMYRRAVVGVKKPLISRGQIVKDDDGKPIIITEYSDRLLEFALKGNRPEKFRERLDIDQKVSGGLNVDIQAAIKEIYGNKKDDDEQSDAEQGGAGDGSSDQAG